MKAIKLTLIILTVLAAGLALGYKLFAPGQDTSVTVKWTPSNEANTESIDHSQWQEVLDNYLVADDESGVNLFDYQGLIDDEDESLRSYIDTMSQLDPRDFNKQEQFAYWVNLYNALTVRTVVENYPIDSIKEIGEATFPPGPWNDTVIGVAGHDLTLNHIEHSILRPIWQDYRIHFAVNCASIGCPNLQESAFDSSNTETLLDKASKQFINHPRAFSLTDEGLVLSSIFTWYSEDFGNSEKEVVETIAKYLDNQALQLDEESHLQISYFYDWSLNKLE